MRSSSVILLSGGLDSLACMHWTSQESDVMMAITFNYGQRAGVKEVEAASQICRHYDVTHRVIELPWYQSMKNTALTDVSLPIPKVKEADLDNLSVAQKTAEAVWVPNRNGVFIHIAAALAEGMLANWVVVGFNQEEAATFPDNSAAFVKDINASFKYSTKEKVSLIAPMAGKTKKEIVRWMADKGVDFSHIWSCYYGDDGMCGTCESCMRCRRALAAGGAGEWAEKLFHIL